MTYTRLFFSIAFGVAYLLAPTVARGQNGFAWIDTGPGDINHGVSLVPVADGDTVADSVNGLDCRRNVDPNEDFYMYFSVDDSIMFAGSQELAWISFHYFDAPGITFRIQYDSEHSPYHDGPSFTTQGTNQWKAYTLGVKNAYFANRQNNGADFRIAASVGATFYTDLAYVSFRGDRSCCSTANSRRQLQCYGI